MSDNLTKEQEQRLVELKRKIIRLFDEIDKLETEESELLALKEVKP